MVAGCGHSRPKCTALLPVPSSCHALVCSVWLGQLVLMHGADHLLHVLNQHGELFGHADIRQLFSTVGGDELIEAIACDGSLLAMLFGSTVCVVTLEDAFAASKSMTQSLPIFIRPHSSFRVCRAGQNSRITLREGLLSIADDGGLEIWQLTSASLQSLIRWSKLCSFSLSPCRHLSDAIIAQSDGESHLIVVISRARSKNIAEIHRFRIAFGAVVATDAVQNIAFAAPLGSLSLESDGRISLIALSGGCRQRIQISVCTLLKGQIQRPFRRDHRTATENQAHFAIPARANNFIVLCVSANGKCTLVESLSAQSLWTTTVPYLARRLGEGDLATALYTVLGGVYTLIVLLYSSSSPQAVVLEFIGRKCYRASPNVYRVGFIQRQVIPTQAHVTFSAPHLLQMVQSAQQVRLTLFGSDYSSACWESWCTGVRPRAAVELSTQFGGLVLRRHRTLVLTSMAHGAMAGLEGARLELWKWVGRRLDYKGCLLGLKNGETVRHLFSTVIADTQYICALSDEPAVLAWRLPSDGPVALRCSIPGTIARNMLDNPRTASTAVHGYVFSTLRKEGKYIHSGRWSVASLVNWNKEKRFPSLKVASVVLHSGNGVSLVASVCRLEDHTTALMIVDIEEAAFVHQPALLHKFQASEDVPVGLAWRSNNDFSFSECLFVFSPRNAGIWRRSGEQWHFIQLGLPVCTLPVSMAWLQEAHIVTCDGQRLMASPAPPVAHASAGLPPWSLPHLDMAIWLGQLHINNATVRALAECGWCREIEFPTYLDFRRTNELEAAPLSPNITLDRLDRVFRLTDVISRRMTADFEAIIQYARRASRIHRDAAALDLAGLQYLLTACPDEAIQPTLSTRGMLLAFRSKTQEVLVSRVVENTTEHGSKFTWARARSSGIFLWLRDNKAAYRHMELVAQSEYATDLENRNPVPCSIFYMALRKHTLLQGLWKSAYGHGDRSNMIKFLANDFDDPRWRTAAQKNAFALIGRQRFAFAASFFLLADRLPDAVNICIRHLDDIYLAIAIARVYEGDQGTAFLKLLKDDVLATAFRSGDRALASWALTMLGEHRLSKRALVEPLDTVAVTIGFYGVVNAARFDIALAKVFLEQSESTDIGNGDDDDAGVGRQQVARFAARELLRMGLPDLALGFLRTVRLAPNRPRMSYRAASPGISDQDGMTHSMKEITPSLAHLKKVEVVPEFDFNAFR